MDKRKLKNIRKILDSNFEGDEQLVNIYNALNQKDVNLAIKLLENLKINSNKQNGALIGIRELMYELLEGEN